VPRLQPPLGAALALLRHRLGAALAAENLEKINRVYAACLRRPVGALRQSVLDKRETPGTVIPRASIPTRHQVRSDMSGCYEQSA
jgi:hypothetical protein